MNLRFFDEKIEKGSALPAWMKDNQIRRLEEDIERMQYAIDNHRVQDVYIPRHQATLKAKKERLQSILKSKPRISGPTKDRLAKIHAEIGESISNAMFTRNDMMKGLADPHQEHKRQKLDRYIEVDPEIAEACHVKHNDGKVTRDGASVIFKITGAALGDGDTNTERLRPG